MEPKEAGIALTNACNAQCRMCYTWKEKNIQQFDSALIEKLPKNLTNLVLSGGEPFLYKDLLEVVRKVKIFCNKSRIVITTNGILTDVIIRQMEKIIKIEPKIVVRVSVDGIGYVHDNIRGVKNAYLNVMATLNALKKLKVQDLGIIFTITNFNLEEMNKVYSMAKRENIKFNCQIVHSSDFCFNKKNENIIQKGILKEQLSKIVLTELKYFNLRRLFKAYYYKGIWNYVNSLSRLYPCSAGAQFFHLGSDGAIYPCLLLNEEMGNLREGSFYSIWNSKLAKQVRQRVNECNLNCWMICTATPEIKNNPWRAVRWIFINKLKAHLGNPENLLYCYKTEKGAYLKSSLR